MTSEMKQVFQVPKDLWRKYVGGCTRDKDLWNTYRPYVERMLTHFWELMRGDNEDANDVKIPRVG